jgi:Rab-GTPase-TBC domain
LRGRGEVVTQQRALFRVLNAIAEAEDGYCQGMNFIAAMFLVEGLDESDVYALFLYILRKHSLRRVRLLLQCLCFNHSSLSRIFLYSAISPPFVFFGRVSTAI